jgi:glycosyltransferase involved in cell wall biosynthesis
VARINLIGWPNAAGISRDLTILEDSLRRAGHDVRRSTAAPRTLHRLPVRLLSGGWRPFDLNIFVETLEPLWMGMASRNILIPNAEWCAVGPGFDDLDAIFCKTAHAVRIFGALHPRVLEVGFRCLDRRRSDGPGLRWDAALHVAGRSRAKGTGAVLSAWERHPEWPTLTVIAWRSACPIAGSLPANVRVLDKFVEESDLIRLQNTCGLHICPSEAEGFGHTIAEAMSCGAVPVTLDAEPMNELVTPERGVLVRSTGSTPMRLGVRHTTTVTDLESAVDEALSRSPERLTELGTRGRAWFEAARTGFERRLASSVREVLAG